MDFCMPYVKYFPSFIWYAIMLFEKLSFGGNKDV